MNWQPIETAPIAPFDPEHWYRAASEAVLVYPGRNIASYSYTQRGKGRWRTWMGVTCPTHWMPLPPPPVD